MTEDTLRTQVMSFLDVEAQVFDDDEDSLFDDDDEDFIDDNVRLTASQASSSRVLQDSGAREDIEDIAERFRKRARTGPAPYDISEETHPALRSIQKTCRFPPDLGIDDSKHKLMMIRVAPGKEMKSAAFAQVWLPPDCLAFAVLVLPGRIYVWAPNAKIVRDSYVARGITLPSRCLSFVPSADVNSVFDCWDGLHSRKYEVGNWVFIRRGTYRNDIAIVREALEGDALKLAVVPRIQTKSSAQSKRPERALVTPEQLAAEFPKEKKNIRIVSDNHFKFRKADYVDNLRIITVPGLHSVRRATPSLHDVFLFAHTDLGDLESVEFYVRRGDTVVIVSGPFQSMAGMVTSLNEETVVLGRVCRIDSILVGMSDEEIENAGLEFLTSRGKVQDLQDSEPVLQDITVSRKAIRRLVDIGDNVTVKAGPRSGVSGFIVAIEKNKISLFLNEHDDILTIRLSWVETTDVANSSVLRKAGIRPLAYGASVMIKDGQFKGRRGFVLQVKSEVVRVRVFERITRTLELPLHSVEECSRDDTVKNKIRDLYAYEREAHNPYVGKLVLIRGQEGKAKFAKGFRGYVMSVDGTNKTAQVSYGTQNTVETFALRSLVSIDEIRCLDRLYPLTDVERHEYAERFKDMRMDSVMSRPSTPLHASTSISDDEWALTPDELLEPAKLETLSDFSGPGMWILSPAVRALFSNYKVHVKVSSKDRSGVLIIADPFDNHTNCSTSHNGCRVNVNVDTGHGFSSSLLSVSDLCSRIPTKKGELVAQIRVLDVHIGRILEVAGLPRQRDGGPKKVTVCVPGNKRHCWEELASDVTKVELK